MINSARNNVRLYLLLASCFALLVSFPFIPEREAHAHKVQMFAHVEGDKVFVEGYFPDGKKAMNSEVTVYDNKSDEELLRGKTDDAGRFSFRIPRKTDLRIALNASLGHKTEYVLPDSDLSDMGQDKSRGTVAVASTARNKGVTGREENSKVPNVSQADPGEIQMMIEKGVEKGVSPLLRGFTECKEKVFLTEIIGGIGYIFGVLGIVLYFKARKGR